MPAPGECRPDPSEFFSSGPGGPRGLLPWGSHGSGSYQWRLPASQTIMVENRGAALTTWQDWATDGHSIVPGAADLARERSPWRFPPALRSLGLVRARLQGRGGTPRVRGWGRLTGDLDAKHGNLGRDQHRYRRVPAHARGRPGRR